MPNATGANASGLAQIFGNIPNAGPGRGVGGWNDVSPMQAMERMQYAQDPNWASAFSGQWMPLRNQQTQDVVNAYGVRQNLPALLDLIKQQQKPTTQVKPQYNPQGLFDADVTKGYDVYKQMIPQVQDYRRQFGLLQ
jgi:hypothetical protein